MDEWKHCLLVSPLKIISLLFDALTESKVVANERKPVWHEICSDLAHTCPKDHLLHNLDKYVVCQEEHDKSPGNVLIGEIYIDILAEIVKDYV